MAKVRETDLRPPYLASALPERQNWEVEILTKEASCLSLTVAITWPQVVLEVRRNPLEAAQVNGIASRSSRMLCNPKEFSPLLMLARLLALPLLKLLRTFKWRRTR